MFNNKLTCPHCEKDVATVGFRYGSKQWLFILPILALGFYPLLSMTVFNSRTLASEDLQIWPMSVAGNILIVLPDRQTQFFRCCHEAAHKCHFQFSFCIQLVGVAIAPSGKVQGSDADRWTGWRRHRFHGGGGADRSRKSRATIHFRSQPFSRNYPKSLTFFLSLQVDCYYFYHS